MLKSKVLAFKILKRIRKYDVHVQRLEICKKHYPLEIDLYISLCYCSAADRLTYNLPQRVVTGIVRCRRNFPFHVVGSADNNPYLINMKYNSFFFPTGEKQNRFSVPHVRIAKLNKIKKKNIKELGNTRAYKNTAAAGVYSFSPSDSVT